MDVGELMERSPFQRWLGVELTREGEGEVEVRLPYKDEFCGDDEGISIHGGVIASLADVASCFAAMSSVQEDLPTVDLRLDYLWRAAPGEDLIAVGRVTKAGGTIVYADVEVRTGSGRVVAVGRGTFLRAGPRP